MAATLPQFMDQIYQHSRHSEWCGSHSSGYGYKLLFVVCDWIYISICGEEAEFRMVVKVQLHH
jgi:hypothetical protein